jgi:hypothetical protein
MFSLVWTEESEIKYRELKEQALTAATGRRVKKKTKSSKQEGLFKQVHKTITLLAQNPRHPSLQTHEFTSLTNPYQKDEKVFEAYVQHKTPGAYRVFWCYGPGKTQITIISITPHP